MNIAKKETQNYKNKLEKLKLEFLVRQLLILNNNYI